MDPEIANIATKSSAGVAKRTPDAMCVFRYKQRMSEAIAAWVRAAIKHAGINQVILAERLSAALGRSIDKAAINKIVIRSLKPGQKRRAVKADELFAISRITGHTIPPSLMPAGAADDSSPDEFEAHNDDLTYEPRMVEGSLGQDVGLLPVGAILQADTSLGLGPGGISHVTDLMSADGSSYGAEGVKDWWRLPDDVVRGRFRVPPRRIRCFEAVGDSMAPTIHDGDIVFIDVGHRVPSPPGVYALSDAVGGLILKRLEVAAQRGSDTVEVRLISDNPRHSPESRTLDEISIIGRYLGRLTTE